jgi:hypothetical protein
MAVTEAPGGAAYPERWSESRRLPMARLIRLDGSGHTTLAEWTAGDGPGEEVAIAAFRRELDRGMIASATRPDGTAEVVRELPLDAELVVMRRQIAGG